MHPRLALLTLPVCAASLLAEPAPPSGFAWKDPEGDHPVLLFDGKPVLEYVRPVFDPAQTPPKQQAIANPTTKVYHHLYDESGKLRLTNGAEGQFPHHRGIFYGFNNISYAGNKADVWHCRSGESQQHQSFVKHEATPAYGRHVVRVRWNGPDGKPFAMEERDLTVRQASRGRIVDFSSVLTTELDQVRLDGDPQHAGFHFRAHADVEKTKNETYFLRPEGKGAPGQEANWAAGKGPKNRPWTAMSFVLANRRFTVVYLDHPDNPKEARQSERTYGRVGTYFEHTLTKDHPLRVRYRLWVVEGEVSAAECEARSKEFTAR